MGTAADEYLRQEFGGLFEPAKVLRTTGATAVSVSGRNPECTAVIFVNTGANTVYLWTDNTVAAGNGIMLAANGGFLSLTTRDDMMLPTEDWWAISPAGASTVAANYQLRSIATR